MTKYMVYGFVQNPHGVDICNCGPCLGSRNPRFVDRVVDAESPQQAVAFVEGLLHTKATWLYGNPKVEVFESDSLRADEESVLVVG